MNLNMQINHSKQLIYLFN